MDTGIEQKETYFVAVKIFLEKNGKLFIFKDNFGDWDLPGGRIKKDEFYAPLEDVVRRKMTEEVGAEVVYELGKPAVYMRHERVEHAPGNPTVRIFAIGYPATWQGGDVQLSGRHTESQWVDLDTFKPEDYFVGGWLTGVQEYLALRKA